MYHTGEFIVYGSSGVCRVLAVGSPEAAQGSRPCTYYTLQPVYSFETIYAPVDSRVAMRPVLTKAEAQQLIRCFPSIPEEHIVEVKNLQTLSRCYQDSFHANSCLDLVRLLKTIHSRNSAARKKWPEARQGRGELPEARRGAALWGVVHLPRNPAGGGPPIYPAGIEG